MTKGLVVLPGRMAIMKTEHNHFCSFYCYMYEKRISYEMYKKFYFFLNKLFKKNTDDGHKVYI